MDPLHIFLSSMAIGLSIAAPVGPIGLLVIQRSLNTGPRAGLATGLGAAAADGIYGAVGAFGVHGLVDTLVAVRVPLALAGAAFLLWMSWRIVRAPAPAAPAAAPESAGLWRHFTGTFLLTLSNPATILSFVAIFGAAAARGGTAMPGTMVLGLVAGSALWWIGLSTVVGHLRARFGRRSRQAVGHASAAMLAAFALWQLAGIAR